MEICLADLGSRPKAGIPPAPLMENKIRLFRLIITENV
jgi:hypothetical protein